MKEQQPICNKINSESSSVISFIESLFCAHMPARARVYTLRSLAHTRPFDGEARPAISKHDLIARAPAHAFILYSLSTRPTEINNEYISKPLSAKMMSQMLNYCMLTECYGFWRPDRCFKLQITPFDHVLRQYNLTAED